jgi:hypothetical protein
VWWFLAYRIDLGELVAIELAVAIVLVMQRGHRR